VREGPERRNVSTEVPAAGRRQRPWGAGLKFTDPVTQAQLDALVGYAPLCGLPCATRFRSDLSLYKAET